jgi:hypothetical protein
VSLPECPYQDEYVDSPELIYCKAYHFVWGGNYYFCSELCDYELCPEGWR